MDLKNIAKKGAKFLAVKKGVQWSGSLFKVGAIAGVGYLAFKFLKKKKAQKGEYNQHQH